MRRPCVLFVSSRSGINPSAGVITDHSHQPYFKSQLHVVDLGHRKPVLILPNGLSNPRERAHDRKKLNLCRALAL